MLARDTNDLLVLQCPPLLLNVFCRTFVAVHDVHDVHDVHERDSIERRTHTMIWCLGMCECSQKKIQEPHVSVLLVDVSPHVYLRHTVLAKISTS